jgi:hypothetical protein
MADKSKQRKPKPRTPEVRKYTAADLDFPFGANAPKTPRGKKGGVRKPAGGGSV